MEFLGASDAPIIPDPEAATSPEQLAMTQAALNFFDANAERMKYFKDRAVELGRTGHDSVITLINVDCPAGGVLAEALMPGHNWQRFRDIGEVPVARGLVPKDGVLAFLGATGFTTAERELREANKLMFVVLDSEVALVLDVGF